MPPPTFEHLRVWHDARRLTSRIYTVTRSGNFANDWSLRDFSLVGARSVARASR